MPRERYIARPTFSPEPWEVVLINPDGTETKIEVGLSEDVAKAHALTLDRRAEKSEEAANSFPQNRRDRDR